MDASGEYAERPVRRRRTVYQTSLMSALLGGVYDGEMTVRELLRHGDFGLGTFNALDGEMVVLDGACYHYGETAPRRLPPPTRGRRSRWSPLSSPPTA